ncbi:uncharacterized protein LOC123707305 isoform X2 [Pieris brassicae]|uniref:uncharacterized protein LOC123707305 isoform X2 n=1 Tax=Pieris brassicae TaxID=7116 RepID=UPI001E6605A9|nr:uncharacterized protein LOC123707305 isoform X2 [Pieris brassicae]
MFRLFVGIILLSSAQASDSSSSSSETLDDLTSILDRLSSAESELSDEENKSHEMKYYYSWLFKQDKKRLADLFQKDQVKFFENVLQYVKQVGKT